MPIRRTSNVRDKIDEIRRTPGNKMRAHERREAVTRTVVEDLKQFGTFFNTSDGYFYFEKTERPRLLSIEHDCEELKVMIDLRYGINDAERRDYEHILSGLRNEAHLRGEEVEVHKLAHYDSENCRLYVSRFDGWVYRLDGRQIRKVSNGADGVFFLDNPSWQPFELVTGHIETDLLNSLVVSSANFGDLGDLSAANQQWLFSVWCRCQFFGSLHPTKPLLLVTGEKGGGKTLALRKWLKLLFGSRAEVTALERSKPDGFVAAVCSLPVAVFDNVDEQVSWLPDHLAQLATGVNIRRRKLYTTNQAVEFQPKCFVALTSRTPKFIEGRDDVLDRTLILQTQRRVEFSPENVQLDQVSRNRNILWTELLHNLNRIVATLKRSTGEIGESSFRMADFASFALNVARLEGQEEQATTILKKMESRRTDMLLAEEPISICLEEWLENPANQRREVTSGELNSELKAIADSLGIHWPYRNAHSVAQKLSHIATNLQDRFQTEVYFDSHAKQNLYSFMPESAGDAPGMAVSAVATSGDAIGAEAGIAGIT